MVSIIRQSSINLPYEYSLPEELLRPILEKADLCSKIVKLSSTGISVFDFNTHELIRNIDSIYYFNLSVSICGTFVVASNEYIIHIWNINTGLKVNIDYEFLNETIEQRFHTFTLNNELLITYQNRIHSFEYSEEQKSWVLNHVYELGDTTGIICIKQNQTEHTFACATISGTIYIYNSLSKSVYAICVTKKHIHAIQFNKKRLLLLIQK